MIKDTKILNTATFIVQLEDHTLGNILSCAIRKEPHVVFCGYIVPHPLEHYFKLRVQTDGSIIPVDAFKNALGTLTQQLTSLAVSFNEECLRQQSLRHVLGH